MLLVVSREWEGGAGGIMHRERVLPSDSSVGLKHGREERRESLHEAVMNSVQTRGVQTESR